MPARSAVLGTPASWSWSRVVAQDGATLPEATLLNGNTSSSMLYLRRLVGSSSVWRRRRQAD